MESQVNLIYTYKYIKIYILDLLVDYFITEQSFSAQNYLGVSFFISIESQGQKILSLVVRTKACDS